ncbi:MAG: RtcB family protein [Armatimonadaceae bacterium]
MVDVMVFGQHDADTLGQIRRCAAHESVLGAVLCGDGHRGYNMPIGGVVAYQGHISPAGVGFDIACGNKAVRTNLLWDDIRSDFPKLMDVVYKSLSFGIGRSNTTDDVDDALFDDDAWSDIDVLSSGGLKDKARRQLGTVGSGNHYVDIFRDDSDRVWIGVHFGSRGLGHTIASHYIRLAGGQPDGNMDAPPALLRVDTEDGQNYLRAMDLAGRYAYAGRNWVCSKVADLLGASILDEVHNHHNYAWKEKVAGDEAWVVRKGATPAFPGQRGFVGGSMGDISVILEGIDSKASNTALYSTVHGAGRVLSRTQAAGKMVYKGPNKGQRTGGQVSWEMLRAWVNDKGVELRGGGTDESPHCYKRLPDVLACHDGTIRVLHTLYPLGVCMAGEDTVDPYKD